MKLDSDAALLIGVCALSILVLGAVESGRVAGVSSPGGANAVGLNVSAGGTVARSTAVTTTGLGGSSSGGSNLTGGPAPPPATRYVTAGSLASAWLVPVLAACLILIGFLYLRLPSRQSSVVDLGAEFEEMHLQKSQLEDAASYRARNEALLRYYALVRLACSKIGLGDAGSETPREYIGRLSSRLRLDASEAREFATAVDEAMYGLEVAPERVGGLAKFMSAFAEGARRAAVGK